jgi:hypothetical protein
VLVIKRLTIWKLLTWQHIEHALHSVDERVAVGRLLMVLGRCAVVAQKIR